MTVHQIEKRLTALEAEVANLKSGRGPKNDWWNKIAGVYAGDPLFQQAMDNGRTAPKTKHAPRSPPRQHSHKMNFLPVIIARQTCDTWTMGLQNMTSAATAVGQKCFIR